MPATKRPKPLYQRGEYKLYRRSDRANLEIVWYDAERGRERSISAGTGDVAEAKRELDRRFVTETGGDAFCPTCGQPRVAGGVFVTSAIADYLVLAEEKPSYDAILARLKHVVGYIEETEQTKLRCGQVDERWIARFRKWLGAKPIVSRGGNERTRSLSTVENSVLQLSAAINECGGVSAAFKVIQPKEVNQTPTFRADVAEIAQMFRFCLYPTARTAKEIERRKRERAHLLSFLRASVATWARPDAVLDISTKTERQQWHSKQRVLNLNPAGRRQTKKYRATLPVARQFAPHLDDCDGNLIPIVSVRSAWDSMAVDLKLPANGQSGMKLIRRSMANLARDRMPIATWPEIEMFLGHDQFDDVSDLYAPFRPDYLRQALAVTEGIIDEIERACPGAFYRTYTATGGVVVALGAAKNG